MWSVVVVIQWVTVVLDRCICIAYALSMIAKLVKFSKVQLAALLDLSKKTGLSVSEHIRRAVDEYIAKYLKGVK